ncbi:AAA family ATPase [Fibrobacter sp. UWH4]|uniref:AAA family ATPase n=1 Tax=Fibrobacter sp. UWH4 TaxID=1896210 RepID=UPI00092450DC|nr:AAA family ATPase [Fibrobacter sp. UWH4]SHL83158.1 AAA ATPase domain-containing protein [Fibrobacter sp. UWH4]
MQFVQREKEKKNLIDAYQAMRQSGRQQLRFVIGEAGSGKTVLINQFLDEISATTDQTLIVSSSCSVQSDYNIPYQPFKELLKQLLKDVDEEDSKKEKFKEVFRFCAKTVFEHAPDLLGNFIPGTAIISAIGQNLFQDKDKEPAHSIDESKIVVQYVDAVCSIAEKYRLALIVDNLQWIDP